MDISRFINDVSYKGNDIYKDAKERCFDRVLGNGYNFISDLLKNYCKSIEHGEIEFEIRIADSEGHCGGNYWNMYNKYLIAPRDIFGTRTGMLYDIIQTHDNANLKIMDSRYRQYKYGNILQEKTVISKFSTVKEEIDPKTRQKVYNTTNEEVIPLIAKISKERRITTVCHLPVSSYAKTYRQTYKINCDIVSQRTNEYLQNWDVDKIVRIFSNSEDDIRFKRAEVEDINNPVFFDMLDLEFEYCGAPSDLEKSLLALIEFIYLAHPEKKKYFDAISYEYQYYNLRTRNRMNFYTQPIEVKQRKDAVCRFALPSNSKAKTIIYDNDENYIIIDNGINFDHFKEFDTGNYSVIRLLDDYAVDIYVYQEETITDLPYLERLEKLKAIETKLWSIPPFWNDEDNIEGDCVFLMDDFKKISIMPNIIEICLKVKRHGDGDSYLLYAKSDVSLFSPLLLSKIYSPEKRNEFETRIFNKDIYINGEVLRFQCMLRNDYIDLVPICIEDKENISTQPDAAYLILEAYAKYNYIVIDDDYSTKAIDILMQSIIEKFNGESPHNVYVIADNLSNEQKLLRLVSNYIKFDNLVYRSNKYNIVNNLAFYYQAPYFKTIYDTTNLIGGHRKNISVINESSEVNSIPGLFKKDMDFIITSFNSFTTLSSFVKCFANIINNICVDGTIVFNYIKTPIKWYNFIYDINKTLSPEDMTAIVEDKHKLTKYKNLNIFVDLETCAKLEEKKAILHLLTHYRPRDKTTLIKHTGHLKNGPLKLVASADKRYIYKINENKDEKKVEEGKIDKETALRTYLLSQLDDVEKKDGKNAEKVKRDADIVSYMLTLIAEFFRYKMNVSYPIDIEKIANDIASKEKACNIFGDHTVYKKFITVQLEVNA